LVRLALRFASPVHRWPRDLSNEDHQKSSKIASASQVRSPNVAGIPPNIVFLDGFVKVSAR